MSLKTEFSYTEDDFVQNGNDLQELTVTITLCEYRNLIKDIAYQDNTIEKLEEETSNLKKQNEIYKEYIIANHLEISESLCGLADILMGRTTTNHPTEKGGAE